MGHWMRKIFDNLAVRRNCLNSIIYQLGKHVVLLRFDRTVQTGKTINILERVLEHLVLERFLIECRK